MSFVPVQPLPTESLLEFGSDFGPKSHMLIAWLDALFYWEVIESLEGVA